MVLEAFGEDLFCVFFGICLTATSVFVDPYCGSLLHCVPLPDLLLLLISKLGLP